MSIVEVRKRYQRGLVWLPLVALGYAPVLQAETPKADAAPTTVTKLEPRPFTWTQVPTNLPPSIKVFTGEGVNADGQPLRAYYADIDYTDKSFLVKVALPAPHVNRDTVSATAKNVGAVVAINAGYFGIRMTPSPTLNTVISDGKLLAKNPESQVRGGKTFYSMRGVFSESKDRKLGISWVAHLGEKTYGYSNPLPNTTSEPAPPPTPQFPAGGREWSDIREAAGGGPVLMKNGAIRVSAVEELMAGPHTTSRHPRSAIGITPQNHIILFEVDGRQPKNSMGMNLYELAAIMKDLGCSEALNLDGGGSSALVVEDKVLNKPSDGRERKVTSIIAIVPNPDLRVLKPGETPRFAPVN